MTRYYRTRKGFEGKPYTVPVSQHELKDLLLALVACFSALTLFLCLAAFIAGLNVGWGVW